MHLKPVFAGFRGQRSPMRIFPVVLWCVLECTASAACCQNHHLPSPTDTERAAENAPTEPLAFAPAAKASLTAVPRFVAMNTVEVKSDRSNGSSDVFRATAAEILSSAGTFGDFSRYLQMFPGVVFNTDESDDILVRGGNPMENLFLVDGFEVPNINHISTEATTGGLVSMIDTAALEGVTLHTGAYNASYEERLSSVVDIHTREITGRKRHTELDAGFIGAGGISEFPLGNRGSLLLSAHRSLLNLFTHNIGLDGVPLYSNELVCARFDVSPSDEITVLSLGGIDSIHITPAMLDWDETSTIQMQYAGWRTTNGIHWRHLFSPNEFGVLTLSDSEQHESIHQQNQFSDHDVPGEHSAQSYALTPVYSQLTHDGTGDVRYDMFAGLDKKLTLISGVALHVYRIDYAIAQPEGEQSVLSADPTRTNADTFAPNFVTGEEGGYAEATWRPTARWSLSGGVRTEAYQFGGHQWVTPRASTTFVISPHITAHAGFGEYAQMPPFIYLTAWPQNHTLRPIRARHLVAGMDFEVGPRVRAGIEAYRKDYRDYPVSTGYPSLSLANMVDTLGQRFLWLPMTSQGMGVSSGVEVFAKINPGAHFFGQANIAYAKARYAGLDHILRSGNFDYPIVANVAGAYRSGGRYEFTWRYEFTSGRPYTPYLMSASAAQDRPIYDVTQINAARGPAYSRLDFQLDRTFRIGNQQIITYGGLENAFDRGNLLGYFWMPRVGAEGRCSANPNSCLSAQYEMKRFPNFGVRYVF